MKYKLKDSKVLIEMYIDAIRFGTSISNISNKLRPILSRTFLFNIYGHFGNITGKKTEFARFIHSRQNLYESSNYRIKILNSREVEVIFRNATGINLKQKIYLDNFKIEKIEEEDKILRRIKKGGQGYSVNPGINPVGGQPVINSYYDCCRPVYLGSLMKGGKANSGYYFDIKGNLINTLPQYKAYQN